MRPPTPSRQQPASAPRRQAGIALLALLTVLTLCGLYLFVGQLSATQFELAREQDAAAALAEAKAALIGDAIARSPVNDAGYLRLPDLGSKLVDGEWVPAEGGPSVSFPGNDEDHTVIGKFPWKRTTVGHIGTGVLRDAQGECLWYVVSGRFKIVPKTSQLNWDTQGQIEVIDANGAVIATNIAALVVAPGRALDGQSRALADAAYTECGGNYDARNYLDSFATADAIGGNVNYFSGSTNNRVALDTASKRFVLAETEYYNGKRFVLAETEHYNDRFVVITVDEVFSPLIRRNDFKDAIDALLNHFKTQNDNLVTGGGSGIRIQDINKGTDLLDCSTAPDPVFCRNWKEMLFLTQLPVVSQITIDGAPEAACSRVLIFSGQATASQSRRDDIEKAQKVNYLEAPNAEAFNLPVANSANFSGYRAFDSTRASADLLRCLK